MLNRRSLLKGAAAFAGVGMIGTPAIVRAQSLDTLKVMTPFAYGPNFIEMLNASAGGFWEANGIDAQLEAGRGGSQTLQQLVAGQTDLIRISAIEQMTAMEATGADLVCFSTIYQASNFYVVSLKDKPIETAEEFAGKTVGLVSVGGSTEIFLDLMLRKAGVPAADVKREVTGDNPTAYEVLKAGRVDAFFCSINVVVELRRQGAEIVTWTTDRYAPMPAQGYVATRANLEARPDLFVRVLKGLHASVLDLMETDTGEVYARAAKKYEIPGFDQTERLSLILKTTQEELWAPKGPETLLRNDPKAWEDGLKLLTEAGAITKITDPTVYWTNEYIDKALA